MKRTILLTIAFVVLRSVAVIAAEDLSGDLEKNGTAIQEPSRPDSGARLNENPSSQVNLLPHTAMRPGGEVGWRLQEEIRNRDDRGTASHQGGSHLRQINPYQIQW